MSARLRIIAGTLAVVGGVGFVLFDVASFSLFLVDGGDAAEFAEIAASAWWIPLATLGLLCMLLTTMAIPGIYRQQAESAGTFGLVSSGLWFAFAVLATGLFFVFAYVAPWLAEQAPELLADETPGGSFDVAMTIVFVGLSLSMLLFGVSSIRARVYPRWIGIVLILAGVASAVPFLPVGSLVLFGAAVLGYGWTLRRLAAAEPRVIFSEAAGADRSPTESAGT